MYRRQELSQNDITDDFASSSHELSYLPSASSQRLSEVSYTANSDSEALLRRKEVAWGIVNEREDKISNTVKTHIPTLRPTTSAYQPLSSIEGQSKASSPAHRGWRRAVITASIAAASVLLVNSALAITANLKYRPRDGVGTIYSGDCDVVKRWNTVTHLTINVLATVLLAASSYTMQCLNSPTRSEVDAAHAQGISLDIGVPNLKNFRYMAPWKTALWLCLCLSTIPLHLLWNSTVVMTGGTNLFNYVTVDESFFAGPSYPAPASSLIGQNLTSVPLNKTLTKRTFPLCRNSSDMVVAANTAYNFYAAGRYTNISATDCLQNYMEGDGSSHRNLILVTTSGALNRASQCDFPTTQWNRAAIRGFGKDMDPRKTAFIMSVWPSPYNLSTNLTHVLQEARGQIRANGTWNLGPYSIERCLTEKGSFQHCQLQYVSYIFYIVIVSNVVKCLCMLATAQYLWNLDEPVLATVGDAVASFLAKEDKTTAGWCLLDSTTLKQVFRPISGIEPLSARNQQAKSMIHGIPLSERQEKNELLRNEISVYQRQPIKRLIAATSSRRWGWTVVICYMYMFSGLMFWLFAVAASPGSSFSAAMSTKFGSVDPNMLIGWEGGSGGRLLLNIILANSFQLLLSTTYFMYNALYTAQCAATEWASYGQGKLKSLRVTWPQGQQRSTYYLQLPWRYAIPLTIMLGLMHFLISESIFMARLTYNDSSGKPRDDLGFMTVGYSPTAVLTTTLVGTLMVIAQVINALRPLDNRIPIHGNKSMVISAICHADNAGSFDGLGSESPDSEIPLKPLMWGVTRPPCEEIVAYKCNYAVDDYLAGHCSFTSRVVDLPQPGLKYF